MKLPLTTDLVKYLIKKGSTNPAVLALEDEWYGLDVDIKFLDNKELVLIETWAKKGEANKETRAILRKLKIVNAVRKSSDKPVRKLEAMTEAIRNIISKLPNKRIYHEDKHDNLLPYFVAKIVHVPRSDRDPQHIHIKLAAYERGSQEKRTETIYREKLGDKGITGMELLTDVLNWQLETAELNQAHLEEVKLHKKYSPLTGQQFLAFGSAAAETDRWSVETIHLGSKQNSSKVVMDDTLKRGEQGPMVTSKTWANNFETSEEGDVVLLPTHPTHYVFDLRTHSYLYIHVNQINPYIYDEAIADKLVLPEVKKQMIDTLVNITDEEGCDIIKGKSGGVIVLSSGAPGTGKTLTAEVFAEASKKPLYVVQCSQLGVSSEELEEKLNEVLERATRWGAVLLIDEADVYIHERGTNVNQNAIVGVFLRLLEYYTGLLFLTTNRETVVDDAIRSRITAHVRYALPDHDEQVALWKILSRQYRLRLSPELIRSLCNEFPIISGRTIKQLVRLVKVLCRKRDVDPSVKLFKEAALFQDIEKRNRTK